MNQNLYFHAFIPEFEVSTIKSREVLPEYLTYKDAIFNISRVAVLLKAFENGDDILIKKSLLDNIHEKYRKKLIYEFDDIKNICEQNKNLGFFISGSGSTLINVGKDFNLDKKIIFEIKKLKNNWKICSLNIDYNGAHKIDLL